SASHDRLVVRDCVQLEHVPDEAEKAKAVVHSQAVRLADQVGRKLNLTAGKFVVEHALQVHKLVLGRLASLANGGERRVTVGNLLDAAFDALAIFPDMDWRTSGF